MDHYSPETRRKVDAEIENEIAHVSRDRTMLLKRLFEAMHDAEMSSEARTQTVIARFAALLCSLSNQADRIQAWMVGLTIAIAIMTAAMLGLTFVMLWKLP